MNFETGTDDMAYLIAKSVCGAKAFYNIEEMKNNGEETEGRSNEHRGPAQKILACTEKVVRKNAAST